MQLDLWDNQIPGQLELEIPGAPTGAGDLPDPGQTELFAPRSAGYLAVARWSKTIHGAGERHAWALECACIMDEIGPGAALPAFPSPYATTRGARADSVRSIYGTGRPESKARSAGRVRSAEVAARADGRRRAVLARMAAQS